MENLISIIATFGLSLWRKDCFISSTSIACIIMSERHPKISTSCQSPRIMWGRWLKQLQVKMRTPLWLQPLLLERSMDETEPPWLSDDPDDRIYKPKRVTVVLLIAQGISSNWWSVCRHVPEKFANEINCLIRHQVLILCVNKSNPRLFRVSTQYSVKVWIEL